ncbi:MAG TPA: hypothetical protein VII47_05870 [Actinomycetota bacterium]|jgi:hypothetical protein
MVVEGERDHHPPEQAFSLSPGIDQALDKDSRIDAGGEPSAANSRVEIDHVGRAERDLAAAFRLERLPSPIR